MCLCSSADQNKKGYTLKIKVMVEGQGIKGRERKIEWRQSSKGVKATRKGKERKNEMFCAVGHNPHLPPFG